MKLFATAQDDGANSEQDKNEKKHWATTSEITESNKVGLPYHEDEETWGSGSEDFNSVAVKSDRNYLRVCQ